MARKTIQVDAVKKIVNDMLRDSIPEVKEWRIGTYLTLERVLFDTGNYHGYRHIDGKQGEIDDTRRYYY